MTLEKCGVQRGCVLSDGHKGDHIIVLSNDEGRGIEFYSTPSSEIPFVQWQFLEPDECCELIHNSIIEKPKVWK